MWVISKSRSCKVCILMLRIQYMAILFDLHLGTLLSYFGIHAFSIPSVSRTRKYTEENRQIIVPSRLI